MKIGVRCWLRYSQWCLRLEKNIISFKKQRTRTTQDRAEIADFKITAYCGPTRRVCTRQFYRVLQNSYKIAVFWNDSFSNKFSKKLGHLGIFCNDVIKDFVQSWKNICKLGKRDKQSFMTAIYFSSVAMAIWNNFSLNVFEEHLLK